MGQREYVFDNAGDETPGRFDALETLFDPLTIRHLTACGVSAGWRCLEVGGGSGSIARWLAERTGATGQVVVTDLDTRFLEQMAIPNVEVRRHNIVSDPLEEAAFDLAHTRLVLVHLPERVAVVRRLIDAMKPGGWLILQEFDASLPADPSLFPSEYMLKTYATFNRVMTDRGVDQRFGRKLAGIVSSLGLPGVEAEGHATLFRGGSAGARLMRANFEQLREPVLASGGVSEAEFEADLARLDDPAITWPSPIMWTVRAQKP